VLARAVFILAFCKIAQISSQVVVLPLVPVTPITIIFLAGKPKIRLAKIAFALYQNQMTDLGKILLRKVLIFFIF